MALAIFDTKTVIENVATVQSLTTTSFTAPGGSRLWAFYSSDAAGTNTILFSDSQGLTWNPTILTAGAGGKAGLAWANVPAGGFSGTVTAAVPSSWPGALLAVIAVTGGEAVPGGVTKIHNNAAWVRDTGSATWVGAHGTDITTTRDGSLLFAIASGWSGGGGGGAWTPQVNQTSVASGYSGGNWQGEAWRRDGLLAIGTYEMSLDPFSESGEMAVVEIRQASGPSVTAELYESGALVATLGTATVGEDSVLSWTWDAAALATVTGANVELRITSTGDLDVGAIEWNAIRAPGGAPPPPPTLVESWGAVIM